MSFGRGPPPDIHGMVSLKVDNLTYRTTTDELRQLFEKYGDLGDVYIPRDRYNRESRGFAFVRFYDRRDSEDAMDALDGKIVDGREIRVTLAKYGRPAEPRRSSPRRRRSRSRSRGRRRRSYSRSRSRSRSCSRSRSRGRKSRSRSRRRSKSRSRTPRSRSRSRSRSR